MAKVRFYWEQGMLSTISDFSEMYHIVMVIGGGMFSLNVDNSFLKFKNNPSAAAFLSTAVVSAGNGLTTRVIGEKISSSSVTSYQISLMGIGVSLCFGLIEILDINSVTLDGGDYQTHWGPCSGGFGSMRPTGLIGWVCPCALCDAQCTKCFGPTSGECEACNVGYYLQPDLPACLTTCPTGYWKDDTSHICAECHHACSECTDGTDTQCSACNPGYYLVGDTCAACHLACSICMGPLIHQCYACNSGYFLQPSRIGCDDSCPDGYWPDYTSKSCQECHNFCLKCSGNGFWQDAGSKQCQPCHAYCSICTSASNTDCTVCNSGFFLQPSSTTCSDSCPTGYGKNCATKTCVLCDTSCLACTGSTSDECSVCNTGYFLQPDSTTCLSSCPDGSWPNSVSNTCEL